MGKKAAAALFAVFIAAACAGAVLLAPVYRSGARDLKPVPDPELTVSEFFDSVEQGDFEKAAGCLSNYSSLGIENKGSADSISQKLEKCLAESYSYELGECSVTARSAQQKVEFTFLPVESIVPDLQSRAEEIAYDLKYQGVEIDEKKALEILDGVLDELMKDGKDHTVTRTFTLTLDYDGEKWLIELPSQVLSAICGIDIQEGGNE